MLFEDSLFVGIKCYDSVSALGPGFAEGAAVDLETAAVALETAAAAPESAAAAPGSVAAALVSVAEALVSAAGAPGGSQSLAKNGWRPKSASE